MLKRILLILYFLAISTLALQGCTTTNCGTTDTYDLCEQILRQPDLLSFINEDNQLYINLYPKGDGASIQDLIRYVKLHFSSECVDRTGCIVYSLSGHMEYEYYGGNYVNPRFNSFERAYLKFMFRKINNRWLLVSIQNRRSQKWPYPDYIDTDE